jgi:hypothetical protein
MLHHRAQSRLLTARRVVALAAATVLTIGGTAVADDVHNELDTDIDATAESVAMNVGTTRDVLLYVDPTGTGPRPADGKSGCNIDGSGSQLVINTTSSDSTVASANLTDDTFTSCGDTTSIRLQALKIGTTTITVGQASLVGSGTFNYEPATFTVTVAAPAPANTAPQVSVTGVVAGDTYPKGAVPSPGCLVEDAEDGNSTPAPVISGTLGTDGLGTQTATCSYTDTGDLTATSSATYSIIDPSAPTIGYVVNPTNPDGLDSWYRNTVTLTWNVSEPDSPNSLVKTGCVNQTIAADQMSTGYTCSATSSGGSAGPVTVSIKRDGNGPSVSYTSVAPTAADSIGTTTDGLGDNGWYVVPVEATFTATDAFSGPASQTGTTTSTSDGAAVLLGSPAFSDGAGNPTAAGAAQSPAFKIDTENPYDISFVGGPAAGSSHYFGDVPAAPTCTGSDDTSGMAGCVVTGHSSATGTHTMTATATDNAGNKATATRTYTVKAWEKTGFYKPVDMGGVLNRVKGGSTVPLKFELFAGPTELTDTAVVESFTAKMISCDSTADVDDLEFVTTGGTSLRYDTTAGQFVQNWKVPTQTGCYRATMTADDGGTISALFRVIK